MCKSTHFQSGLILASRFSANPIYKDNSNILLEIKTFLHNKANDFKLQCYNPARKSTIDIDLTLDKNKNKEILFNALLNDEQKLILSKFSLDIDLEEKKNQVKTAKRKI